MTKTRQGLSYTEKEVRKLKEKALAGVVQTVADQQVERERPGTAKLLSTLVFMLLGLVIPQGTFYGTLAPFGVSMAAAVSGTGSVLIYISTITGYLLSGGIAMPLRYMAAVAVAGATRWTFQVLPSVSAKKIFPPLTAFSATLVSGLIMNGGISWLQVLLTVAESVAAGGFAYFFAAAWRFAGKAGERTSITMPEQIGVILIGAVVLMAVAPFEFYYISPGRIVAGVVILLCARGGREQSGTVAGAVLGVALALSAPDTVYVAVGMAFGGLLAGVFSRYGRFAAAGVYLIGYVLVCLAYATDLVAAACIYEAVCACIVFVILPRSVDKMLRRLLIYGQHIPAVEGLRRSMLLQMGVASGAIHEVADTVDAVSQKLSRYGAPDLGSMYRQIGDTVCKDCSLKLYCWEHHFSEVMDSFNQLTPILRETGQVTKEDLTGFLSRSCHRGREVARAVTGGYETFLLRESGWRRLSEIRSVISDQFSGMGTLLEELGDTLSREKQADVETAGRIVSVCEDFGMPVEEAVCLIDTQDRLTVEILAEDVGICLDGGRWLEEISLCCGREFDKPSVLEVSGMVKITMTERPRFRAEIGVAQHTCAGEKMSGDVWEQHKDGGKCICILSDGMGSGGRAAVDGALAAGITARLLRAGLTPDTVLKMVNTALLAKSGDESLTTLDVLEMDLFTGNVQLYKAGAAVSLLKSKGRVSRLETPSLPVGILRDVEFAKNTDTLVDGDTLILMSDGMASDGVTWIEEHLQTAKGSAQEIANGLLEAALSRDTEGNHRDDMTVAAVCLHNRT
jgi:stage II sporulation protein E